MADICEYAKGSSMDSDAVLAAFVSPLFVSGLVSSRTSSHSHTTLVNSLHCRAYLCILNPVLTIVCDAFDWTRRTETATFWKGYILNQRGPVVYWALGESSRLQRPLQRRKGSEFHSNHPSQLYHRQLARGYACGRNVGH
jgi:hypothetical protein